LTLPGVPALWRGWSDAKAIPSSVRLAISAGAPLKLGLEQSIHAQYGLKIHNFYGASECGGIAYDSSALPRTEEACVGRAMTGVELSIASKGCLEVRGGAVGETYWPELDAALGGGVFTTSDLAEIRDGCVHLQGRLGDQINVAGRKVAPETVESALRSHPGIKDCLVFGVPATHGDRTDNIAACVVMEKAVEEKALKQFLQQLLPAWQIPREWWFVASLPAGERGKISRVEWARRYLKVRNRSAVTDHPS
jgi:long-chain acyl-CoA synthetase